MQGKKAMYVTHVDGYRSRCSVVMIQRITYGTHLRLWRVLCTTLCALHTHIVSPRSSHMSVYLLLSEYQISFNPKRKKKWKMVQKQQTWYVACFFLCVCKNITQAHIESGRQQFVCCQFFYHIKYRDIGFQCVFSVRICIELSVEFSFIFRVKIENTKQHSHLTHEHPLRPSSPFLLVQCW